MGLENLWYLAHPVAPCKRYTLRQNLAHAEKVARIAWDAGFRVVMPWFAHCHFLEDSNEDHRQDGLECDKTLIRHIRKVIYTGHRISSGMAEEAVIANEVNAVELIAVGIPDRSLSTFFQDAAKMHL